MTELELRLEKAIADGRPDAEIEDLRFLVRQNQELSSGFGAGRSFRLESGATADQGLPSSDPVLKAAVKRWIADGPKRTVSVTDGAVTLSEGLTGRTVTVRVSLVDFSLRYALERWSSQYGEG